MKRQQVFALLAGASVIAGCGGSGIFGSDQGSFASGIYVADSSSLVVRHLPDMSSATANNSPNIGALSQVAFDQNGFLYISVRASNRVLRCDALDLSDTVEYGSPIPLASPDGLAFDSLNRLYIADCGNEQIVRVSNILGNSRQTLDLSSLVDPTDRLTIAVDSQNRIYVLSRSNRRLYRFDSMSDATPETFGNIGSGTNQFELPGDVTLDNQGRIYIADSGNDRVVRINDMSGAGWTTFGTSGSGTNQFDDPQGVAIDSQGRILVGDRDNERIVRINDMTGAGWTASPYTTFGSMRDVTVK